MIVEIAEFSVVEGREDEFEQTMLVAREVVARSPGFVSIDYGRGVERPSVYQLRIVWETLENHLRDFRESELYVEWARLTRPFFASDPRVEHFAPVASAFPGLSSQSDV